VTDPSAWLDDQRLVRGRLVERFSRARPFSHVVVDDFVCAEGLEALTAALADEPADRIVDDIYEVTATAEPLTQPLLQRFARSFERAVRPHAEALAQSPLERTTMRGFAYGPAHYLLPHADHDADALRRIAFVIYLAVEEPLAGGELELFDVALEDGEVVSAIPAGRIAPLPGRLVLFEVSERSLHQVCEVTSGLRVSLAGWFCRC
jgi:hypothetical protein